MVTSSKRKNKGFSPKVI